MQPDPKKVFVIHGRNQAARLAVEHFLKALKLEPICFDELAGDMATEFVGNIVLQGLQRAHGIVALFTADEYASLFPSLRDPTGTATDSSRWQSRPNVIFEAGIAFGIARERSVLVTLGQDVSLFSDIAGIHILRLSNSLSSRGSFRQKLIGAGCQLDLRTDAWTRPEESGDFDASINVGLAVTPRDPFALLDRTSNVIASCGGSQAPQSSVRITEAIFFNWHDNSPIGNASLRFLGKLLNPSDSGELFDGLGEISLQLENGHTVASSVHIDTPSVSAGLDAKFDAQMSLSACANVLPPGWIDSSVAVLKKQEPDVHAFIERTLFPMTGQLTLHGLRPRGNIQTSFELHRSGFK
jgi:hypothetical protein